MKLRGCMWGRCVMDMRCLALWIVFFLPKYDKHHLKVPFLDLPSY